MKFVAKAFVFSLLFSTLLYAQQPTREQKLQKINDLRSQIQALEQDLFLPDAKDLKQAEMEGFNVFRILPRERYDRKLAIQGGGSYYSFTTGSHDYQKIAQIGLEQNHLKVGFAGADYGFIADLGEISLSDVTEETAAISFLVNYKPPLNEHDVRVEQLKAFNYEANSVSYKNYKPVVVGHSYVLRAISFGRADVLVALKVSRKDEDGSLIVFWKLLKNFEKPLLARNQ